MSSSKLLCETPVCPFYMTVSDFICFITRLFPREGRNEEISVLSLCSIILLSLYKSCYRIIGTLQQKGHTVAHMSPNKLLKALPERNLPTFLRLVAIIVCVCGVTQTFWPSVCFTNKGGLNISTKTTVNGSRSLITS